MIPLIRENISQPSTQYFLSALSGVCMGSCFWIPGLWPLALMGVSLLISVLVQASTLRRAFVCGLLSGAFLYGSLFTGVGISLLPFDWYGIEGPLLQMTALVASIIAASLVLGVSIGFFGLIVKACAKGSWYDLFLIPSVWVVCEGLAAFLYYVYMLGPGSFFGPHFTMGYIGYFIAEDPVLLQLAWLGGVYLLSFSMVLVSVCIVYTVITRKKYYGYCLLVLLVLWGVGHAYIAFIHAEGVNADEGAQTLSVAVISRYMPPTSTQGEVFREERYRELLLMLMPLRSLDMVVFPENAAFVRTFTQIGDQSDHEAIRMIGQNQAGPVLIDSHDSLQDGIFTSSATFYQGGSRQYGQKQFLLAFGEYLPHLYQFVLKIVGGEKSLDQAIEARNYVPGENAPLSLVNGVLVAVRFCDEVMSPFLYREQVREGAEVLINISSLSWFHGSPFVYENMKRIAKVRAVESGRWFVQSGNMAPAFVLDERGSVRGETLSNTAEVLVAEISPKKATTPFIFLGVWAFLILTIPFILSLFFLIHTHVHKRRETRL